MPRPVDHRTVLVATDTKDSLKSQAKVDENYVNRGPARESLGLSVHLAVFRPFLRPDSFNPNLGEYLVVSVPLWLSDAGASGEFSSQSSMFTQSAADATERTMISFQMGGSLCRNTRFMMATCGDPERRISPKCRKSRRLGPCATVTSTVIAGGH